MAAEGYRRRYLRRRERICREEFRRFADIDDDLWRYSRKYGEAWFLPRLLFHSNWLGVWRFLHPDSEKLLETLLTGDRDGFKRFIEAAINRAVEGFNTEVEDFRRELESSPKSFDEFHRQFLEDVRAADTIISDVREVTRDGFTFRVEGRIPRYEVGLFSSEVCAICAGGHTKEHICIHADGNVDAVGGKGFKNVLMGKSVQITLHLLNDDEIAIDLPYDSLHRVAICPLCFKEGRISRNAIDALLNGGRLIVVQSLFTMFRYSSIRHSICHMTKFSRSSFKVGGRDYPTIGMKLIEERGSQHTS